MILASVVDDVLLQEKSVALNRPRMWSLRTPMFCMNAYTGEAVERRAAGVSFGEHDRPAQPDLEDTSGVSAGPAQAQRGRPSLPMSMSRLIESPRTCGPVARRSVRGLR